MDRRDMIALLGGAAILPVAARAQQPGRPVVGFLNSGSPGANGARMSAFRKGLGELGYVEGQNLAIEYRWADGQYDRLATLAAELVSRQVSVIAATGGLAVAIAAKAASRTIPIVFNMGADGVQTGLVASLNRPGGNITGVSFLSTAIAAKELEVLHGVAPDTAVVAALVNPTNPTTEGELRDWQEAARILGLRLQILNASTGRDIDAAFETLVQGRVRALIIQGESFFNSRLKQLVALTVRHAIPAIYTGREFVDAGGLMSYGANIPEAFRITGLYAGRILKGERPGDLPVQQATKVELIVNLTTAKAIGLTVPLSLLAIADEVIE
jgi:putative ABC transport system substrate-binding protein